MSVRERERERERERQRGREGEEEEYSTGRSHCVFEAEELKVTTLLWK